MAWIVVEGALVQDGRELGPGALVYPESLLATHEPVPLPDRDAHAMTRSEVRALAIRADDFRELCDDDNELGEALLESLAAVIARRQPRIAVRAPGPPVDPRGTTDPHLRAVPRRDTEVDGAPADDLERSGVPRDRAETVPDEPTVVRPRSRAESPVIAPAPQRASAPLIPVRPSPPLPSRPSPLPPGVAPRSRPGSTTAQPPIRPSPLPGKLTPRPTPIQAQVAAALPHTPPPAPAPGLPKAQTAGAARPTPVSGTAPIARPESVPRATPVSGSAPLPRPRATPVTGSPALARPDAPSADHATASAPAGFTRATPPAGTEVTPRVERHQVRPPTDPEIETYLELEADLPPEHGGEPDLESALALSLAFSGDLIRAAPADDTTTRVIETDDGSEFTVTTLNDPALDDDRSELTVTTLYAPDPDELERRETGGKRAITADDASSVSGVISIAEDDPPARREGRDE